MKFDVNGSWRSIGPKGTVTINRVDVSPLSLEQLNARIKTGEFKAKQYADAVANLKRLKNTRPASRAVARTVVDYVTEDVVRLG